MSGITDNFLLAGEKTNPTCGDGRDELLLHDLFVRQARQTPNRPAVISNARTLTYGDLLVLSRAWANKLQALGVKPDTLVAIIMPKGWEQIVAVLGVLQSGAAYVPIDPTVPAERLAHLLGDAGARIALTQSGLHAQLSWPSAVTRFCIDTEIPESNKDVVPSREAAPDNLAYVLYTSGSTGNPKGVMIAHRGVVNCIVETNRTFRITEDDRALAVTALHHDMSVYDIFGMLSCGGALVIPDAKASRSPDHWVELMGRERVTIWNSVPGFMEMLLEYAARQGVRRRGSLRLAFLGGDWIPLNAPARIREHFGDVDTVSVGGPTETTVWNIWYPVKAVDPGWRSIPYGHPIANNRYYILDDTLEECPPGQPGELCCAGVGLMKGYWKREELTRSRFASHPVSGERIYRTGDRGCLRPDGEIEFLGRMDLQVKINGQRIELGEIEAHLGRHPGVRACVAKAVSDGLRLRLAAYVVAANEAAPAAGELRAFLESRLPNYMIPAAFVMLDAFPLNANGKVDRNALLFPPAWTQETPASAVSDSGVAHSVEDTILSVWRNTLKVERIGRDDNFFDLGGNSLLLIEAHAELQRRLERQLAVTLLFEFPSVRSLARHLEDGVANGLVTSELDARSIRQREAMARRRAVRVRA